MLVFHRIRKPDFLLLHNWRNVRGFTTTLYPSPHKSSVIVKSFSSNSEKPVFDDNDNQSFALSYLVNSCGLTLQAAKSVSKRVNFKTAEKPDSILNFLRSQGFNEIHISRVVKRLPQLLLSDPEIVLPKFQFFRSKGASSLDLATIFFCNADLFKRSLDKHIIPCYNALRELLLDDDKVVKTLKRASWIFTQQVEKSVPLNVSSLRKLGVPESLISYFITTYPSVICQRDDIFQDNVQKVIEIGFLPSKMSFIEALAVNGGMSKETVKSKMEAYKRCGLSDEAIWSAFKKKPMCFRYSEKKITSTIEFLVNEMGYKVEEVVPHVLCYSLEKRIIPRCLVIRLLRSKVLIKDEVGLNSIMIYTDEYFFAAFVFKYKDKVPQIVDMFKSNASSSLELGLQK